MKVSFKNQEHFKRRQIGPNERDLPKMLETIGVKSLDELIDQTIPAHIRLEQKLQVPEGIQEHQFLRLAAQLANRTNCISHISVSVIQIVSRPV